MRDIRSPADCEELFRSLLTNSGPWSLYESVACILGRDRVLRTSDHHTLAAGALRSDLPEISEQASGATRD